MAAATTAAATAVLGEDFFHRRHTAFFQRLGHKAIHHVGDVLQRVLGSLKIDDRLIGIGLLFEVLELLHFLITDLLPLALAVVEVTIQGDQIAIQAHSAFVRQEGLRLIAGRLNLDVCGDGSAEFVEFV